MIKTPADKRNWLDQKTLYKEALYIHLINQGYTEDRAKLVLQKILNRAG